jgi:hypothetical protein
MLTWTILAAQEKVCLGWRTDLLLSPVAFGARYDNTPPFLRWGSCLTIFGARRLHIVLRLV